MNQTPTICDPFFPYLSFLSIQKVGLMNQAPTKRRRDESSPYAHGGRDEPSPCKKRRDESSPYRKR